MAENRLSGLRGHRARLARATDRRSLTATTMHGTVDDQRAVPGGRRRRGTLMLTGLQPMGPRLARVTLAQPLSAGLRT